MATECIGTCMETCLGLDFCQHDANSIGKQKAHANAGVDLRRRTGDRTGTVWAGSAGGPYVNPFSRPDKKQLAVLAGLDAPNLTELNVASNRISSIEHVVDRMPRLQSLNLADNRLYSYREVISLSKLDALHTLSFADPDFGENPICFLCNYSTYVLYHLPKLQDGGKMGTVFLAVIPGS
ncbi:Lrrc9 [Symbiodinium natans]|uniref:Lrrc9 protein n=1 Tax=Symbiodinium natans TaxID=878477 RepID=A0A812J5H2_9DINO|nr:Lrrc9 [Symbiodinium natans]